MDTYPESLLAGVSPLVFAVNAIVSKEGEDASDGRRVFDRFLDVLAASLVEEGTDEGKKRQSSIFRSDDDSDEDDGLDLSIIGKKRSSISFVPGFYSGFGRMSLTRNPSTDSGSQGSIARAFNNMDSADSPSRAYARLLTHGQDFFQRARIQSVSPWHGLPPSKDPDGVDSLAHSLVTAVKSRSIEQLAHLIRDRPFDGILSEGWLEKHVHALPSVIVVVTTVGAGSEDDQTLKDQHLSETVRHLQQSMCPKRRCTIQVVGLISDDVESAHVEVWSRAISALLSQTDGRQPSAVGSPQVPINLLRPSLDLDASDAVSPGLRKLHQTIRDASMTYYLGQARRAKEKLNRVREASTRRRSQTTPPVQLLPLATRYCFKIAIFYEFQWKHEKSVKFMAEGYRHVSKYYLHLLAQSAMMEEDESLDSHSVAETDESVEVALSNSSTKIIPWSEIVPSPPDDMIHQCRVVAEWINLKLMSAGFSSQTEGGLLAASDQWRHHSRVFCTRRNSTTLCLPDWFEWASIARQRLLTSQFAERHPPQALGGLGDGIDETILRCSPWRCYMSAVEATLRLAAAIDKVGDLGASSEYDNTGRRESMRPRYVGSSIIHSLNEFLKSELKVKHRDNALEMAKRAISLFECEMEREKRGFFAVDEFNHLAACRSGARLYYLTGGILLGMGRHLEAVSYLTKAATFAHGWKELELAIRRMLIECYETYLPTDSLATASSETLASMILDSYFNAEMSSKDLRKALDHFAASCGGQMLKWRHETTDDEDSNLPFSFAVCFPWKTHATSGDTVKASVLIQSNLDYAVHVNSVVLLTLAGDLNIAKNDLMSASNASEGTDGGIIMQAKTAIIISTEVELPRDTSMIAPDESGNGGEMLGVAGKGSFAKIAKPRSAGMSSAAGVRFLAEDLVNAGSGNSQGWNLRFLGGKPLRCDGLRMVFYPVQVERASGGEAVTYIELTIHKVKARTAANIKRTPFEEENYLASAWSRPQSLPLSRGPRSLRVLEPAPQLLITNMTQEFTDGKALEGTVNRILLKLQAGMEERCSDIRIGISCFSVLVTPSGSTKRLVQKEFLSPDLENSVDMTNPRFRTPVLVSPDVRSMSRSMAYGYEIPGGWNVLGSGQKHDGTTVPPLKGGECSFFSFDIFRPAALMQKAEVSVEDTINGEELGDVSLCKTDFYVTITYMQERPMAMKRRASRRPIRRLVPRTTKAAAPVESPYEMETSGPTGDGAESKTIDVTLDQVSLEYSGSLVWTPPLAATFAPGVKKSCPSGSRHPSNTSDRDRIDSPGKELSLFDGESVVVTCALQLDSAIEGIKIDLVSVHFQRDVEPETPLEVSLKSSGFANEDDPILLYNTSCHDPSRTISVGTSFSVAYSVEAHLKSSFKRGGVSAHLGGIQVAWLPSGLSLPAEVLLDPLNRLGSIQAHGPLVPKEPSLIRFMGPSCYVESAPFEAELLPSNTPHSVSVPFQVRYSIRNQTDLHQTLHLRIGNFTSSMGNGPNLGSSPMILSGITNGEIILSPKEHQFLSYSFLVMNPGPFVVPTLQISSLRYKSWIIHEGLTSNQVFVFP